MLRDEIESGFDPTDADAASQLADSCGKVLEQAARAIWSENHGMHMGRDTAGELGAALVEMGNRLGLVPYHPTGREVDSFWEKLWAETGLVLEKGEETHDR